MLQMSLELILKDFSKLFTLEINFQLKEKKI